MKIFFQEVKGGSQTCVVQCDTWMVVRWSKVEGNLVSAPCSTPRPALRSVALRPPPVETSQLQLSTLATLL